MKHFDSYSIFEKRKAAIKKVDPYGEEIWDDVIDRYIGRKLFCLYPHRRRLPYWVCPHCGARDEHPSQKKREKMERRESGYTLDVGILNTDNIGGIVGLGLRGNFWYNEEDFRRAINKQGDMNGRKLYTLDEIDELLREMGYGNQLFDDGRELIREKIKQTRSSYSSSNPDGDRRAGLYVELDEIFDPE